MTDNLPLSAPEARRTSPPKTLRWLITVSAAIGFLTVLVSTLPLAGWWARLYSGPLEQPDGDTLIILSAASDDQGVIAYSSYWRTQYALAAWRKGAFRRIVISGGGGPGIRDFLVAEGVPSQNIIAEWQSKSTQDSGSACAHILQNLPGKRVLLTSDFHMYRSIRVFRKAGINIVPMPVPDVIKASRNWNGRLPGFETMIVETAKIVYYRLRGWI